MKLFLETCFADVVFFGSAGISLQLRLLTPPEIFLAMDLDEAVDETQVERPLRGFRRRWTSDVAALDEPSPGHISEGVGEDLNLESQPHLFSGSNVDSLEFDQHALDWDFIGHTCD